MTPFVAELIGTCFMILLGGGVVANVILDGTKGNNSGWLVITTAWGFAVFVGVVIAGPYSGAHLNPAVSIAMFLDDNIDLSTLMSYSIAQFLGAMAGAFGVWLMYWDHFKKTADPAARQGVFCTAPAVRNVSTNLFSEILGTFVLIYTIFHFSDAEMAAETAVPIGLGSVGALPVALLVWVIGLALGGTTGYAINPARDLGPRIVHALLPMKNKAGFDLKYAWIPVVGPVIGSVLATLLYLYTG